MLKGHVEEEIPALDAYVAIVPSCKAKHPWADVHNAKQQEKAKPFIAAAFVLYPFSEQQKAIHQPVYKKYKQQSTKAVKDEWHGLRITEKGDGDLISCQVKSM